MPRSQYEHAAWTVRAAYNLADFYDLFGPTKVSRKGYSLGLTYADYILYDRPTTLEYTLGIAGYAGLERLPLYQNVATTYDNFLTARANSSIGSVTRSLGAVDEEKGVHWSLNGYTYYVRTELFPLLQAGNRLGDTASTGSFFDLVAGCGRAGVRGSGNVLRQFLLRGIRQQLGRPPGGQTVP